MAFCQSCGSPVEGRYCAKCGAASGDAPAAQPAYTSPSASSSGLSDNLAAALCYFPIIGLIFLLIEPYNRNKTVRFHAFQSLFLVGAMIVINIVMTSIIGIIGGFLWAFYPMIQLGVLAVVVVTALKAYKGEKLVLPVIGPLAEKQA